MSAVKMNGADSLCDTLLAHDVDVCFANPGTSEMHFVAALDRKPQMRCVLGLFEGVVTGAADGYARMADKPAATLLHLGPGLANGLANLHNARRAHTPIINVVGEHATWHQPYDAPLASDIESLARPMSDWVHRIHAAGEVSAAAAQAVHASRSGQGGIATLILPADAAWDEAPADIAQAEPATSTQVEAGPLQQVAGALRAGRKTVLLLSGKALRAPALELASRIAQKTGARIMAQQSNGRMQRGVGRVPIERVPFSIDLALTALAGTEQLVLIGARAPVAFFAYPGKPSTLAPPDCEVVALTRASDDLFDALSQLAQAVGVSAADKPVLSEPLRPDLPNGALDAASIIQTIGVLCPENAVICDESVTSGRDAFKSTHGAAPHDFLQITGGAIGIGLPLAAGAAVACPDRKVILMQADGSGMYTMQALWTHAREQLDVVTVVFANRSYAILHNELKMVGAGTPGSNAKRMLDLDDPAFDWVSLARASGVEAVRATTTAAFIDAFKAALARKGPFLIEAVI